MVGLVTPAGSGLRLVNAALAAAVVGTAATAAPAAPAAPALDPVSAPGSGSASASMLPTPASLGSAASPASSLRAGATLPDPMRPSGGLAIPGVAAPGRPARTQAEARPARLQSVLLGGAGAQAAVIDGTLLAVGDRLGEARLLRLTERSAVLIGPQGKTTTLLLIPGVDKRDAATLSRPAAVAQPEPEPAQPVRRRPAEFRARLVTETTP